MYGFRTANPRMRKAQAEQREQVFAKQDTSRRLLILKLKPEQFTDYQENHLAA
jgi:hypothetical protein